MQNKPDFNKIAEAVQIGQRMDIMRGVRVLDRFDETLANRKYPEPFGQIRVP